jgi:hypothetical protein
MFEKIWIIITELNDYLSLTSMESRKLLRAGDIGSVG